MRPSSCVVILLVVCAACSSGPRRAVLTPAGPPAPRTIRVGVAEGGKITVQKVPFEAYVQGTIIAEFAPASGDAAAVERMYEVQAIVGRTYAMAHLSRHARDGYDLCSTTHCQLFQPARLRTSRWGPAAAEAVRRTAGEVLWYGGAPASALYHADCGGHTSSAADVWGGATLPYLLGVSDGGAAGNAHAAWRYEAQLAAVQDALNADARTRPGARLNGLQVLDRDPAGRAEQVAIHGRQERIVRGDTLRDVLAHAFGARSIRSTLFEVHREGETLIFEGRGFGHGVGLCQAGAMARVRAGETPLNILHHYYPGTSLVALGGN